MVKTDFFAPLYVSSRLIPLAFLVLLTFFVFSGCERESTPQKAPEAAKPAGINLKDTRLAAIPEEYEQWDNIAFSADGQQVVYKAKKKGVDFMVAASTGGEKTGHGYESISWLIMSRDGRRYAFGGEKSRKQHLVIDTIELTGLYHHDVVAPNSFTPDGRYVGCEVGNDKEKEWFVTLLDGEKEVYRSQVFPASFRRPLFSPDGRLLVYELGDDKAKEKDQKRTLFFFDVKAGKIIKERLYVDRQIGSLSFNSNSSRVIYDMQKQGKYFLVLQDFALNKERTVELPYTGARNFVLSPDGQQISYLAAKGTANVLVVSPWEAPTQGKEKGPYEGIGPVIFSPGSGTAAFIAVKEGKWRSVVGEREGAAKFDGVGEAPLVFSSDGAKIAHPAMKGGHQGRRGVIGGKWVMVVSDVGKPADVKEGPAYDMVISSVFSPDGKYIAYRARTGPMEKARRFIVIAEAETGKVIKEGPAGDEVWPPVWNADSKAVGYGARVDRELWWKIVKLPD